MRISNKGFSLIELSLTLTIAAIMAVTYLSWAGNSTLNDGAKTLLTLRKMEVINKAITNFVVINNRLPCPAKRTQAANTTYAGGAGNISFDDEYVSNTSNGMECVAQSGTQPVGVVPTRALGLSPDYMVDGWGRRFTYHVSGALCGNATSTTLACGAANYMANSAGDIIIRVTAGGSILTSNAAYIIVSHGSNGLGAYRTNGNRNTLPTINDELENADDDTTYIKKEVTSTFSNIISYRIKTHLDSLSKESGGSLISQADCQANSDSLPSITLSVATTGGSSIRSVVTSTRRCTTAACGSYYNNGDEAVLDLMWTLQNACYEYYSTLTRKCPGGTTSSATYDSTTNSCTCASGLWENNC
jgi:prepilin-type N-terminal cleavage/methylation domain-containing protein